MLPLVKSWRWYALRNSCRRQARDKSLYIRLSVTSKWKFRVTDQYNIGRLCTFTRWRQAGNHNFLRMAQKPGKNHHRGEYTLLSLVQETTWIVLARQRVRLWSAWFYYLLQNVLKITWGEECYAMISTKMELGAVLSVTAFPYATSIIAAIGWNFRVTCSVSKRLLQKWDIVHQFVVLWGELLRQEMSGKEPESQNVGKALWPKKSRLANRNV